MTLLNSGRTRDIGKEPPRTQHSCVPTQSSRDRSPRTPGSVRQASRGGKAELKLGNSPRLQREGPRGWKESLTGRPGTPPSTADPATIRTTPGISLQLHLNTRRGGARGHRGVGPSAISSSGSRESCVSRDISGVDLPRGSGRVCPERSAGRAETVREGEAPLACPTEACEGGW